MDHNKVKMVVYLHVHHVKWVIFKIGIQFDSGPDHGKCVILQQCMVGWYSINYLLGHYY